MYYYYLTLPNKYDIILFLLLIRKRTAIENARKITTIVLDKISALALEEI